MSSWTDILVKNFFVGITCGGGEEKELFWCELLPWIKTERKICSTYQWGRKFVVKAKGMGKTCKFKDFICSLSNIQNYSATIAVTKWNNIWKSMSPCHHFPLLLNPKRNT